MVAYITELNKENYKNFTESQLSLVDIWAPWCGPCRQISPIVDEISSEYLGKISVGKLNADDNSDIVGDLGVRSIPTILIYKDGEIVERMVGMSTKQKISSTIENYL